MNNNMTIAYLAPEIPALSATFVYNEILEVEKHGITVVPISVHVPGAKALEGPAQELAERTCYLYRHSLHDFLRDALIMSFTKPQRFVKALLYAGRDALHVGPVSRTAAGILYRFFAASTVARILIRQNCTHIHAHFAHIPADIVMYASLMTGVPYSFTAHANDIFVRGWLLDEKVRRSKFAVAISGFNRDFLAAQGAPRDKIQVIHCGVDSGSFTRRETTSIRYPVKLGSLGRMVEKKGFNVLIDACRILKSSGVSFAVEIAGDGPLKQELLMQASLSGLSGEIKFIGSLGHDKVPGWLKELDLFVLPCKEDHDGDMDGIPVVLMEAMLSGVPVVSTRLTGIPELIEDRVTGYLADPGDPRSLASAIKEAIRDPQVPGNIIREAIDKVHDHFDLSKNASNLEDLFRRPLP